MDENLDLQSLSNEDLITLYEKVEEHKKYLVECIINETVTEENTESEGENSE